MKKIIALILVTVLCLGMLASCSVLDSIKGLFGGGEDAGLVEADLLLNEIYKSKNGSSTSVDFDVVAQVQANGKIYPVKWSCDSDKIVIRESTTAGFYTVDLPAENSEVFTYTLTANISNDKGETKTRSYSFKMLVVNNSAVVTEPVEGTAYKLFLTQNNLGKKLYALNTQQMGKDAGANQGKYIKTTTVPQNGVEFFVEKVDGGYKFYTLVNGVKNYILADYFPESEGKNPSKYIGFSTEEGSVLSYNTELGGVWTVTIEGNTFGIGTYQTFDTICISESKHYSASAIGSSQFVMQVITAAYANTLEEDEEKEFASAEDIVNAAYELKANASLGEQTLTGIITEINSEYSSEYKNVTVTIVVGDLTDKPIECFRLKGTGADQIKIGDEITVTGILRNYTSYNDDDTVKVSKVEFDSGCTLDKWPGSSTGGGTTTCPFVVGTEYYFGYNNAGTMTYLDGTTVADRPFRWNLTTNTSSAVKVVLETAEGGYYVSYTLNDTKYYMNIVESGEHVNLLSDTVASSVWVWNSSVSGLVVDVNGTLYIPKAYNNFDTIEAKTIDYTWDPTYILTCLSTDQNTNDNENNNEDSDTNTPADGQFPGNLVFTNLVNKESADTYMSENFPEWTITGNLGAGYGGYLGFGRSNDEAGITGDRNSAITSSKISTTTEFRVSTVLKGNGSNGVMTSTLTFTLIDKDGNTIATGYANGSTTAAITPVNAADTTYTISFTLVEGKTWSDVSNLVVTFAKSTGNIGLKTLDFIE